MDFWHIYRYTSPICFASKSFETSIMCLIIPIEQPAGSIALKWVLLGWKALIFRGILGFGRQILWSAACAAFHLDGDVHPDGCWPGFGERGGCCSC